MTPELWAEIRRLFLRESWSQRSIASHLRVDPKTVKRAVAQATYQPKRRAPPRGSMLDPYKDTVRQLLDTHPHLTQVRLLQEIRARGYEGGISVLGDFVRSVRPAARPEAFLQIDFPPGDAVQVDWAHCGTIEIEGERRRLSAFLFLSCWSRYLYVEFTVSEKLEVFLACHVRAMEALGGVTRRALYDNLRSVVLAHVGREVRLNPRFLDFARHYSFVPVACNPYRPNEKGRVENAVRFLRRGFLDGREITDLERLNRQVSRWLADVANVRFHRTTKKRPVDLLEEERPLLWPLPDRPYDTRVVKALKASPMCRVRFEGSTYSTPPAVAGAELTLKASDTEVSLYAKGEEVARHPRAAARGQDIVDPAHVRALLERKRRGERGVLVNRLLALGPQASAYLKGLTHAEIKLYTHLKRILALVDLYGAQDVQAAMEHALGHQAFGADYVERILLQERRRQHLGPTLPLRSLEQAPDLAAVSLPDIDLGFYDRVLGTESSMTSPHPKKRSGGQPPEGRPHHDPRDLRGGAHDGHAPEAVDDPRP